MKSLKTLLFAFAMLVGTTEALFASPLVSETPIRSYGTPTTVSVSAASWTNISASQSLSGQSGYIVSTSSAAPYMAGHLGNCTSTSIATTVRPLSFVPGTYTVIPASDNVCLWALSLNGASADIHIQEFKQ